MKWTTNRANLSDALGIVNRAASRAVIGPPSIRVEAADGWLTLCATDYEISVTHRLMAEVSEPGVVLLPADRLTYFVAGCRGDSVTCRLEGTTATLTGTGSKATLRTLNVDSFPEFPALEGTEGTIPGAALTVALERVLFAAGDGKDRPVLRAVEWRNGDGSITVAACDGYRLATDTIPVDAWPEGRTLLIPSRSCGELTRLLDDGDVQVMMGGSAVEFTSGPTTLRSQLLQGEYPAWPQLMPQSFERSVTVQASALRHDARLIARLDVDTIRLYLDQDTGLTMRGSDAEKGDVDTELLAAVMEGDAGKVALETDYLVDALGPFGDQDVVIGLNSPSHPVGLRYAGESPYRQVIMPKFLSTL